MPSILRLYDDDGSEIGWMNDDGYEWEITHPDPDQWSRIRGTLQFYAEPEKIGRLEVVETEFADFHFDCTVQLDDNGPDEYLREVASALEEEGVHRTEIVSRDGSSAR